MPWSSVMHVDSSGRERAALVLGVASLKSLVPRAWTAPQEEILVVPLSTSWPQTNPQLKP